MARPVKAIPADALAEAKRYALEGRRPSGRGGFRARQPSYRSIARRLQALGLTSELINPSTMRRALERAGVAMPRRR